MASVSQWSVGSCDQFIPYLLKEGFDATVFDVLEGDSVNARGAFVLPGHPVGFPKRFHLADVNVQSPESPGLLGLCLDKYPLSQVLQINGRFYHFVPAFPCMRL